MHGHVHSTKYHMKLEAHRDDDLLFCGTTDLQIVGSKDEPDLSTDTLTRRDPVESVHGGGGGDDDDDDDAILES